jgi:hypothetical protein
MGAGHRYDHHNVCLLLCVWIFYNMKLNKQTNKQTENSKKRCGGVPVAHAYNSSDVGGRDQEDCGLRLA